VLSRTAWRGGETLVHLYSPAAEPMAQLTHHNAIELCTRRSAADQDANCSAVGRHRHDVVLALARFRQINMRKVDDWQTLVTKAIDQPITLPPENDTFMYRRNAPHRIIQPHSGRHPRGIWKTLLAPSFS